MIQRKQTLFLLLAVIAAIACLCLPIGEFATGNVLGGNSVMYNLWIVRPDGSYDFSVWALFVILLVTCPISLMAIFSYKNRMVQSRFCMFNILLALGWYIVFAAMALNTCGAAGGFRGSIAAALPAVSLLLHFMARKAVLAGEAVGRPATPLREHRFYY